MNEVYLNKVFIRIEYSKEVRAKGKRSKHISKQTIVNRYNLELILNEKASEEYILKYALFKLEIKVKPKQKAFLERIEKIKKLGL